MALSGHQTGRIRDIMCEAVIVCTPGGTHIYVQHRYVPR